MLFTSKEKKQLAPLFDRIIDPDEYFTLESLHGFLFGLAISPDIILPSEWIPIVLDEDLIEIEDEDEADILISSVFNPYNRIMEDHNREQLNFPFNMKRLREGDLERIRDWTGGLIEAMQLRHEMWCMDCPEDMSEDQLTEEQLEISTALFVLMGIAAPDAAQEILEEEALQDETPPDLLKEEFEADLFATLPAAVAFLMDYGLTQRKNLVSETIEEQYPLFEEKKKIGRNEPCSCGSGKKFKRCCGRN